MKNKYKIRLNNEMHGVRHPKGEIICEGVDGSYEVINKMRHSLV